MSATLGRTFRLALGALMVLIAACAPSDGEPAGGATGEEPMAAHHSAADHSTAGHSGAGHSGARHAAHQNLDAGSASDYSIYHASSSWTDQTGTTRELDSLAGRPQVVAMLYTSCAYACPRIMLDMKRIEGELGSHADDVGFVIVSIDPDRDTPERLAEFAAGSRLDPDRWTLLTADEGDVLELAALLGVQYRQTEPGEWVHSNLVTVLDPEGEVVHRQLGLGTDPTETIKVLRSMLGVAGG